MDLGETLSAKADGRCSPTSQTDNQKHRERLSQGPVATQAQAQDPSSSELRACHTLPLGLQSPLSLAGVPFYSVISLDCPSIPQGRGGGLTLR